MAHLERGERLFKYIDRGSKKVRQVLGYYRDFADQHLLEKVEDMLGQDLVFNTSTDKIGRFVNRVTWLGFTPKPDDYEPPAEDEEDDLKEHQPLLTYGASVKREPAAADDEFRIELRIGSGDDGYYYREALRELISDPDLREEYIETLGEGWNVQVLHQAATRTPVTDEEEMQKFQKFLAAERAQRLDEFINQFGDEEAREQISRIRRRIRKNTISIKEYQDKITELKEEHLGEFGTHDISLLYTISAGEYIKRFHPEKYEDELMDEDEELDQEPEELDEWILDKFEELVPIWNQIFELADELKSKEAREAQEAIEGTVSDDGEEAEEEEEAEPAVAG